MSISVRDALLTFKTPALIGLVGVTGFIAGYLIDMTIFTDTAPKQPIDFSHRIHVSDNGIPCLHCHNYADTTPAAGVPSVSKCMGCHKTIATDRPEVMKLAGYWENQEPIPWIKVHDVPDFVYFTHKRHVLAGLECQVCHGPVETMDRIARVSTLKMPWCVECHTERKVEHGRDCWTCHK